MRTLAVALPVASLATAQQRRICRGLNYQELLEGRRKPGLHFSAEFTVDEKGAS